MMLRRRGTPTDRDLAAFADGSLPARRRAEVQRALAESPQLRASVAAQQSVLRAIDAAAAERAPAALHAQLELANPPEEERTGFRVRALLPAAAVAAIVAVLALVLGGGGALGPTVVQASVLTSRAPQHAVSSPGRDTGSLPGVRGAGLTYPYWQDNFGYRAVGVRFDRLGGRRVTTVFYSSGARRLAYEIISGPPLRPGAATTSTVRQGLRIWTLHTARGTVVTWQRDGHSCVITGAGTSNAMLVRLAAWHQGGRIPY